MATQGLIADDSVKQCEAQVLKQKFSTKIIVKM
jgi:hypothetical protein